MGFPEYSLGDITSIDRCTTIYRSFAERLANKTSYRDRLMCIVTNGALSYLLNSVGNLMREGGFIALNQWHKSHPATRGLRWMFSPLIN